MQRRQFLVLAAAGAGVLSRPGLAGAQSFAGKQIRVVVPFPAGGPTDIVARPLAQMLGDALKGVVLVDNRGGAGGGLGADAVAKSAPDGQTLLMATVGTHAINPALYKKLPYDAVKDFTPIGLVAMAPVAIVVHPSLQANNVAELVSLAKEPGRQTELRLGGRGNARAFDGRDVQDAAGIDIQHVPYRGSAPAVTDLIAGQIQIMFDPLQSVLSNVQGRQAARHGGQQQDTLLRAAQRADHRRVRLCRVLKRPRGGRCLRRPVCPRQLRQRSLAGEIEKIARSDEFRSKLEPLGVVPTALSRQEFCRISARRTAKWGKAVRDSGASWMDWDELTGMKLNDEEQDILAGKSGVLPQEALRHQKSVGEFFGAADFVPVTQAHIMADTESLGEAGVLWLERLAATAEGQKRCVFRPSPIRAALTSRRRHARSDAGHARSRTARHRSLRQARRDDDRHLHQLSDDAGPDLV